MRLLKTALAMATIAYGSLAYGLEVAGVSVDESVVLQPGNVALNLQGAGVRTKFFVDVYVGALYSKKSVSSPRLAVAQTGAKRMKMIFLYDGVTKAKMQKSWLDGMKANNPRDSYKKFAKDIDWFVSFFDQDMKPGDEVTIGYIAAIGTKVQINNEEKGRVAGMDFYNLVLNTWMGDKPPSKKFRKQLLSYNS
jgi:hypothetical protein